MVNDRQEKDMPPEREKLTKEAALLLEAEGKEAEQGDWKFEIRVAVIPQGGEGSPCPPLPPPSPSPTPGTKHWQRGRHTRPEGTN